MTHCPNVLDVADNETNENVTAVCCKGTVRDAVVEDHLRYRSVLTSPSVEVVVDKTDAQRRVVAVQRLP